MRDGTAIADIMQTNGRIVMNAVREEIRKTPDLKKFENILRRNSISVYLKEIDQIPLLSRDAEVELAKRAYEGDRNAKEKMIISNLRFVISIAKKYQGKNIPLADLISEGNIGLITAVDKFDYRREVHFISYAVWWIKQAIMKAISEKSRMVRLPMNRANELMKIGKFIENYSKENGKRPDHEEIADKLSMNKDEIKKLIDLSSNSSLEEMIPEDSSGFNETMFLSDGEEKERNPDNAVILSSLKESIQNLLNKLGEREREIIEYRFGLNGKEPQSLSKIGEKMKLTKERIRQLEKIAIDQIKGYEESSHLYAYLN
jgi:RNA polymerase primary sigma factor